MHTIYGVMNKIHYILTISTIRETYFTYYYFIYLLLVYNTLL